jgi:DNA (cytosine-5)-methyltransferase 1
MTTCYKVVDLFAGTGAFSLSFEKSDKFEVVLANDFDENSKKIYDLNCNGELCLKDIHKLKIKKIPDMDILSAGFPCQGFSIAGKKLGFEDERSNVFWKLIKIIEEKKPRIIILENVKNLQSHDKGQTFKIIKKELKKLDYYIKHEILNTCDITKIPQNRERIYIVCFKKKKDYDAFEFPKETKKRLDIKNLLDEDVDEKYYYGKDLKVWKTIKNGVTKHVDTNTVYQYRRTIVRENKSEVCPTLTANMGAGGHNVPLIKDDKGIRKLTPRECFRLQGFSNSYKLPNIADSKLYKLAGNAVTVKVVRKIVKQIEKILK